MNSLLRINSIPLPIWNDRPYHTERGGGEFVALAGARIAMGQKLALKNIGGRNSFTMLSVKLRISSTSHTRKVIHCDCGILFTEVGFEIRQ